MSRQTFDTLDQLRITIERDAYPGELYNRIDSPNGAGDLGVWGWNTPTPLTAITSQIEPQRMAFLSYADQTETCSFTSQTIDMDPGQWIRAQYLEYPPYAAGGYHRSRFVFFDAGGTVVGEAAWSPYWLDYDGPVTRTRGPDQAPAGTVYARLVFECYSIVRPDPLSPPGPGNLPGLPVAGYRFDLGNVRVGVAGTSGELADLNTLLTGYPTVDITGEAGEVNIVRTALDVGTLTATFADEGLDPARTDALRPGRRIVVATGGGEPLFTGRTYTVRTEYGARTLGTITLTATDAVAVLARTPCAEGYRFTDDLRAILDRAVTPIPWSVNGDGSQTFTFGPDAIASGSTLLDQVIRTRDTNHAHAWVDRAGALRVYDRDSSYFPHHTVADTLTEDDYTGDLAPAFDSEQAINSVEVVNLTGTESVTYGPFGNYASIRKWGELTATYTVVEVPSPTAYATEVLITNADPQVTVQSVTLALSTPDRVARWASLDLCQLLRVTCTEPALDLEVRVASIEHSITGTKWLTTVGLLLADRVPLPTT